MTPARTEKLLAYHDDPGLKARVLERIAAHRAADEIQQGVYYATSDGRAWVCAVGCVLHDPEGGHERYETKFGIPVQLAHLEDTLFETMATEQAKDWPRRFMSAIKVGADLSTVWPKFASWLMVDETWGVAELQLEQALR